MKGKKRLTAAQKQELLGQLTWHKDRGFDVDVDYGPFDDKTKLWNVLVRLGSIQCRVKQLPNGYFLLETGSRKKGGRPACGTNDVNEAIYFAEKFIDRIREFKGVEATAQDILGQQDPDDVHCGINVRQVRELLPHTALSEKKTYNEYLSDCRVAEYLFGGETLLRDIYQDAINDAVKRSIKGLPELGPRWAKGVKPNTAVERLQDFGTAVTYVAALQPENVGVPKGFVLVPRHPLLRPNVKWPDKGRDARREPATTEFFDLLMNPFTYTAVDGTTVTLTPPVDAVDPTGRLRLVVAFAYYTGRRMGAITNLRWENLISDKNRMRNVLSKSDYGSRPWADAWSLLIDFVREHDKEGHYWPVPAGELLMAEIELYRARCTRHTGPLFRSVEQPGKPASESYFTKAPALKERKRVATYVRMGLVEHAFYTAIEYLERSGRSDDVTRILPVRMRDPEEYAEDLPFVKLVGERLVGRWAILTAHKNHIWRHCHATEMEEHGWSAGERDDGRIPMDLYASYMGSWATGTKNTRDERYCHLNPELLLACASWKEAWEARQRLGKHKIAHVKRVHATSSDYIAEQIRKQKSDSASGEVA